MGESYAFIYNTLTPQKKLLQAINNNSLDEFNKLIENSDCDLIHSILDSQSEETTLHLCTHKKNKEMVEILLQKGADPLRKNLFNASSIDISMNIASDSLCFIVLLEFCPIDLLEYWSNFKKFNEDILKVFVIGSQSLYNNHPYIEHFKKQNFHPSLESLKLISFTNHSLPATLLDFMNCTDLNEWYSKRICQVSSLRHCARIRVRKSLRCNVYYCSSRLCLPTTLQKYLIDFNDCLD